MARYYAGYMVNEVNTFAIFRATAEPTRESHGSQYAFCNGPYPTRTSAEIDTRRWYSGSIRHVDGRRAA